VTRRSAGSAAPLASLALACAVLWPWSSARAQTVSPDFYITNGQVVAEVLRGNTLYIGGMFNFVGPVTGAGVPVDVNTEIPAPGFPRVNGTVMAAIPDGAGGWFIGGQFSAVGASVRSNLAHVLADQSVAAWNPGTNGIVRALLLRSGLLYAAGDFTTLGGITRNRVGAADASTGVATSWNPNANSSVRTLATNGSVLWAGGQFTTIGAQSRNRIAQLDFTTGAANATWNPNANSTVNTLAWDAANSLLYVGGQFTAIDGNVRNRLAVLDPATGHAQAWNPNANNQVNALAIGATEVYVGGLFSTVGGQPRSRIAAISAATGSATAWDANAGSSIQALALSGTALYAGGDFLTIGGQGRSRIAALDLTTGNATAWDPSAFNTVNVITLDGTQAFVGGAFNGIGGTARNNLAAIDVTTGVVTAWNPNANNMVQALAATQDLIYAGGNFSQVGGKIRNNLAALDLTNGNANSWDPNADGQVSALAVSGNRVYVGGLFGNVGGQPRANLAAVDAATGLAQSWIADTDDQVFAIDASTPVVYVGGNFVTLGGVTRNFVGAVSAATGSVTSWDPNATGTVRALSVTCDRAFIGGFFTTIGGQTRNRLASVNLVNGQALGFDPNANGPVFALLPQPGILYVGGVFSTMGVAARNRAAAVDPQTGAVRPWNPNSNGTVRAIVADGTSAYVAGMYSSMGNTPSGNLAAMSLETSVPCPVISLTAPPLPAGVVGTPYVLQIIASGGTSSYCFTVSAGALPAGLTLNSATGQISGTPTAAGVSVFSVTAADVLGCAGTAGYTLTIAPVPAVNHVAANGTGLCLNPSAPTVAVPFVLTRGDATALRGISTTFQLEASKLRLASPGTPASNVHLGTWAASFANRSVQVTDLGSGRYTVDLVLLGAPCGEPNGGSLFTLDVAAVGPTGTGAITVQSVTARDCSNGAVAMNAGAATTVNISGSTITLSPTTLPGGSTGTSYSQTLSASGSPGPFTFAVSSGALPNGLTLSSAGLLSGTVLQAGAFNFTIAATEAGGCAGFRAYSVTFTCPAIAVTPVFLPDGAVSTPYSATLDAPAGVAPRTYAVTAGTLPNGVTLAPSGALSGSPTQAGTFTFTIQVTDGAGCTGSRAYSVDIFSTAPNSSVAANTTGLAISTAHPCVSVPIVYTRGEATPARAVSVSFQLDATKLALCSTPESSVHLGSWFNGFSNTQILVTDDGDGAYTVEVTLLGLPCGITTGGTLFTVDLKSVGADGSGAITVTRVKSRDCDNTPIAVAAGAPTTLRIQNTPITLAPPTLPNGLVGQPYSQAITAESGVAPFTFSVSAGALPAGLTLSTAGLLAGTPNGTGSFSFTVSVVDVGGVPGSRAYTMSVACPVISITPGSLVDAQLNQPYSVSLVASGGTAPYQFTIQSGSLPAGLTLANDGQITGTPTSTGAAVFTVVAVDDFDCVGTEVYTLPVFTDPAISRVRPVTAGLCLSGAHTCVSVPFVYTRGDTTPAAAAHVTFQLDPRFALCGTATASIHIGSWLSSFSNKTFQVVDNGGGSYTVDQSVLGLPCGPTTGGTLFTVDVAAVGGDGVGDITVNEVRIRDCSNQPLPGQPGPAAQLVVNHSAPPHIFNLATAQVVTGNPAGSRTGITVTFTPPAPGTVALYRAPFGSYPEYDDDGGVAPDSAAAPGTPWTLVTGAAVSGLVDTPPVRGFFHYVAFLSDSCGNVSAVSNRSSGSLDYHLGDVTDGITRGNGDNKVTLADVTLLGAHYGKTGAAITTAGVGYLDVGPTVNGSNTGRPATDDALGFDDLMVFSTNYHVVSSPQSAGSPDGKGVAAAGESFELDAPALVAAGDEFDAVLHLAAAGTMQGFSARLGWDAGVLQALGVTSAGFLEGQEGIALSPGPAGVDGALLGVRGSGIRGQGDVARFRFRALRDGVTGLKIASVIARDATNRPLAAASLAQTVQESLPAHTMMLSPSPNPARGLSTLAFALSERGEAELSIFSVDGGRVRTLAHGPREAGAYKLAWRGEDDAGKPLAPGVYWARLTTRGLTFTRRIVFLR
jgi:hypothetical protein